MLLFLIGIGIGKMAQIQPLLRKKQQWQGQHPLREAEAPERSTVLLIRNPII